MYISRSSWETCPPFRLGNGKCDCLPVHAAPTASEQRIAEYQRLIQGPCALETLGGLFSHVVLHHSAKSIGGLTHHHIAQSNIVAAFFFIGHATPYSHQQT